MNTRRRDLVPAERVREARALLKLTQAEFAARIGVTPRTVIRAEQRGLGRQGAVRDTWKAVWSAALDTFAVSPGESSRSDTLVSSSSRKCHVARRRKNPAFIRAAQTDGERRIAPAGRAAGAIPKKRLRLARDRLREWRARRG